MNCGRTTKSSTSEKRAGSHMDTVTSLSDEVHFEGQP